MTTLVILPLMHVAFATDGFFALGVACGVDAALGVGFATTDGDAEGVGVATIDGVGVGVGVGATTVPSITTRIVGAEKVKLLALSVSQPFDSLTEVLAICEVPSEFVTETVALMGAWLNPYTHLATSDRIISRY